MHLGDLESPPAPGACKYGKQIKSVRWKCVCFVQGEMLGKVETEINNIQVTFEGLFYCCYYYY